MAIWYVSNEAINGYTVGDDTTGNGSAALPYLTIAKAITVAANTGDTIYVNGTLFTVNSVTVSKAVNLQPTVAYGTTIKTTNATRCLNISHALGGTNTVGAFYIDCDNVAQLGVQLTASAGTYSLVMSGTRIINTKNYGVGSLSGTLLANVSISDGCSVTSSNAGFTAGVTLTNLSAGSLSITGTAASPGLTITATAGATNVSIMTGVAVTATSATGVTCSIAGLVESITMSTEAATRTAYGLLIKNVPAVYFGYSSLTMASTIATHRIEGINITNTTATFNSIAPVIEDVTMALTSANTGHAILVGEEEPNGILDNRTNNAIIRRCTIVGSDDAATAGYHGIMLGNNTGGVVSECSVSRVKIGLLAKHNTGSVWHRNQTRYIPATGQHMRSKATTAEFYVNTCTADTGYSGIFISNTENDGATVYSNSTFELNTLVNPSAVAINAVNNPTGNTIRLYNNVYGGAGVLSFINGATTYASLALYRAAEIEDFYTATHTINAGLTVNLIYSGHISAAYINP